jgi:hypothetical protein
MAQLDPLIEEALVAALGLGALEAFIALLYWRCTGLSPWPFLILAQTAAFGSGIALLSITSPRHRR